MTLRLGFLQLFLQLTQQRLLLSYQQLSVCKYSASSDLRTFHQSAHGVLAVHATYKGDFVRTLSVLGLFAGGEEGPPRRARIRGLGLEPYYHLVEGEA